jgi:hypothetical protein
VATTFLANRGLRGHAIGKRPGERRSHAASRSKSSTDAPEHLARLQIFQNCIHLCGRADRRRHRLEFFLLGERDDFLELLQVAYVRAHDGDRTLRDRLASAA